MSDVARLGLRLLKGGVRPLVPERTRVFLGRYRRLLRAKVDDDVVVAIVKPNGSRILVLAPHPDDEIIGCGGTLRKHCLAGDDVTCIYLTSGEATGGRASSIGESALVQLREQEARNGAKIIGFKNLDFFHQRDGDLQPNDDVVLRLSQYLGDLKPDVVYLPFFMERHPDHLSTNRILMCAYLRASPRARFYCCAYETVDPMPRPNCVVDIEKSAEAKSLALQAHETARKAMNIVDPVLGLNMHRALHVSKRKGYAEAFVYTTADDYFRLFEAAFPDMADSAHGFAGGCR